MKIHISRTVWLRFKVVQIWYDDGCWWLRSKVTLVGVKGHIGQGHISIPNKGRWAHNYVKLLHFLPALNFIHSVTSQGGVTYENEHFHQRNPKRKSSSFRNFLNCVNWTSIHDFVKFWSRHVFWLDALKYRLMSTWACMPRAYHIIYNIMLLTGCQNHHFFGCQGSELVAIVTNRLRSFMDLLCRNPSQ